MAAQVLVAMTAMPPSGWNFTGATAGSMAMIRTTPGTLTVSDPSKDATCPPKTGHRATTACNMPSILWSMP